MKTNEFIKEVKNMGFEAIFNRVGDIMNLEIRENQYGGLVAYSEVNKMFIVGIQDDFYYKLEEQQQQKLFKLLTEYASTPVEDRKEENKYMYYIKNVDGINLSNNKYLSYYYREDRWLPYDGKLFPGDYQYTFTHSELKELGVNIEQLKKVYKEVKVIE